MVNLRMARVLVSGSSGPIGKALLPTLRANGAHITRLVRNNAPPTYSDEQTILWHPEQPLPADVLSGFDAVIHLAGETIVGRWTESKKSKIRDSRVKGTRNLTEESAPGSGFLAEVCQEWEAATHPAAEAGIRTVAIRSGVVLSREGGALAKMLPAFKMGVGGKIGDGRHWMSWIDVQDLVGAIHHILKSDLLYGPVNMVAPRPVTNAEFTQTLASVLSRPAVFPMPAFAVKLLFGEMGESVLLGSQRVEPTQLVSSGYPFRFRELRASLQNTLKT